MNTKIKRQMTKTIEKMINDALEEIKKNDEEERKKKKLYAKFLKLIKPMIVEMLKEGYEIKMINQIVNNAFKININYTTFFRWVKRNITQNEIESKKSNIKGKDIKKDNKPAPVSNQNLNQSQKEVKNETTEKVKNKSPEKILEEVKSSTTGIDEDFDRNAGKTKFLDDI